jgi:hypothetical protein
MARWNRDVKLSDPESVGYTVIAGWWPTTYHRVITFEVSVASATDGLAALTKQLHEMFPERCGPARDFFMTRVHRTDRYGIPKSERPTHEIEYQTRAEALDGHRKIVAVLQ